MGLLSQLYSATGSSSLCGVVDPLEDLLGPVEAMSTKAATTLADGCSLRVQSVPTNIKILAAPAFVQGIRSCTNTARWESQPENRWLSSCVSALRREPVDLSKCFGNNSCPCRSQDTATRKVHWALDLCDQLSFSRTTRQFRSHHPQQSLVSTGQASPRPCDTLHGSFSPYMSVCSDMPERPCMIVQLGDPAGSGTLAFMHSV